VLDGGVASGIAVDVTEQQVMAQNMEDADRRLRDAIECISESFSLWDKSGKLLVCNTKFQEITGATDSVLKSEPTLAQIRALGIKVLRETQQSADVTAEFTDLDARRKNLEAYEVELQKLLETVRERTGKALSRAGGH